MKKLLFITFTILIFTFSAFAQDTQPTPPSDPPKRLNLLQELGLSSEQVQAIRTINQAQKPKMEAAQRSFRKAQKALDEAIYSDNFLETDVLAKTKDVQVAQAQITKIKAETEFSIRKVLTAEQIVKFRELRQRSIQNLLQKRPILKNLPRKQNQQQ
jgi:Spy/CpxP family protein refolding chaperone